MEFVKVSFETISIRLRVLRVMARSRSTIFSISNANILIAQWNQAALR